MVVSVTSRADQAKILLSVFDGTRRLFPATEKTLLRVRDGQQNVRFDNYVQGSTISLAVPFFDNFGDDYTVLVTADGRRDAGFHPVKVSPALDTPLDLMLVPKKAQYSFLSWDELKNRYPHFCKFLSCAGDEDATKLRYQHLCQYRQAPLAALLNLIAAMSTVHLPSGTPLDYFRRIEWEDSLAQDRFFGFADEKLVQQVKSATAQGVFVPEPAPALFHRDATSSYKQVQFGEANVQITFHENAVEVIGGTRCIRLEPDIDYYKDQAAHALLEVIPNMLSHGLTDPQVVYVLRWIAGRHAGVPEFDPAYTLV